MLYFNILIILKITITFIVFLKFLFLILARGRVKINTIIIDYLIIIFND